MGLTVHGLREIGVDLFICSWARDIGVNLKTMAKIRENQAIYKCSDFSVCISINISVTIESYKTCSTSF